jgi:stalled ribosome rescue protein Dom34
MRQVAVWMDQNEAKVFDVGAVSFEELTIHSPNHHVHRHPMDEQTRTHNHPDDEHRFFNDVVDALATADQVLLVGPSVTKMRFFRYLQKQDPGLAPRIVGLETIDHPSDRQLVAHVRQYFHSALPRNGTGSE